MLRDGSVGAGDEATWCGVESEAGYEERCEKLHRTLRRIVKARGALDAQEAAALREAEDLKLWRQYGYASLLEYMELEMGYSPRAALERLRVAKAIEELPKIGEAMTQGDLSFSGARELTRVATAETEQEWLEAAEDKNLREVEEIVSGRTRGQRPTDPADPKLKRRVLRYDVKPETVALVRQAKQLLERELGERLDDDGFMRALARLVIDGAHGPERTKAPYQVAVTTCEVCKRGWQDGAGVTVEMAPPALEAALCDAEHIGSVDTGEGKRPGRAAAASAGAHPDRALVSGATYADAAAAHARSPRDPGAASAGAPRNPAASDASPVRDPGAASAGAPRDSAASDASPLRNPGAASAGAPRDPAAPGSGSSRDPGAPGAGAPHDPVAADTRSTRARQSVPPALRRKVMRRDHGRCRVPACRSTRNLDQHHIVPRSEGGAHTEENILTLCESHHLAHHAGALAIEGTASNPRFTRRAHNAFAIAERAVETARALETMGFEKHEVRAAMQQARTHVGTAELTLDQWIRIALGYCPKPTTGRAPSGRARRPGSRR